MKLPIPVLEVQKGHGAGHSAWIAKGHRTRGWPSITSVTSFVSEAFICFRLKGRALEKDQHLKVRGGVRLSRFQTRACRAMETTAPVRQFYAAERA